MSDPIQDPYQILGLQKGASAEEIRKRYKKLAVENHPDRNSTPAAVERFKQVSAAYSILNDPVARQRWEQGRANTANEVGPQEVDEPLRDHRSTARSRPVSQAEKRRREEFAERFAESILYGREMEAEKQRKRKSAYAQNFVAALLLSYFLISSLSNQGIPFNQPAGREDEFLIFLFWGGVMCGLFLIWTPDVGQDVVLDKVPAPLLQFLGWLFLLGTPTCIWLLVSLSL